MAHREYCDWKFMPTEITFIFRKFEAYIHSSIGSRSVSIDRLARRQAGRRKRDLV